jgi:hypothetical protein
MRVRPSTVHKLPSRKLGSFGHSPLGAALEFMTLSWFRFEVFLIWLVLALGILANPWPNTLSAMLFSFSSPLLAIGIWILLKATGWIFYFVPAIGRFWGWSSALEWALGVHRWCGVY